MAFIEPMHHNKPNITHYLLFKFFEKEYPLSIDISHFNISFQLKAPEYLNIYIKGEFQLPLLSPNNTYTHW